MLFLLVNIRQWAENKGYSVGVQVCTFMFSSSGPTSRGQSKCYTGPLLNLPKWVASEVVLGGISVSSGGSRELPRHYPSSNSCISETKPHSNHSSLGPDHEGLPLIHLKISARLSKLGIKHNFLNPIKVNRKNVT